MAPSTGKDPWLWTVDEVVDALCNSKDVYAEAECASGRLPDLVAFGQQLRCEEVDGGTLLTAMDQRALKEDFGIKALGHRHTLSEAIKYLRAKSAIYQRKNPAEFLSPFGTGFHTPGSFFHTGQTASTQSPPLHFQGSLPVVPKNEEAAELEPTRQLLLESGLSNPIATSGQDASADNAPTEIVARSISISGPDLDVHVRTGESAVVNESGRKRRKLNNLISVNQDPEQSGLYNIAQPSAVFRRDLDDSSRLPLKQTGPQLMSTSNHGTRFAGSFPVKDVFFWSGQSEQETDEETELCIVGGTHHPTEVKKYVYRQMRHFLYNPEQEAVLQDENPALAIYPYRKGLDTSTGPRAAMLYQRQGDGTRVTYDTHTQKTGDSVEDARLGHQFDYMVQRWVDHPGDDEELLPYGESGSEISYSSSFIEQFDQEQQEKQEQAKKEGSLTVSEISRVVEECIANFREKWRRKKMPLRENTAWMIWKQGRKSKDKRKLLEDAKAHIDHLYQRLSTLVDEIITQVWQKQSAVRQQCKILEETIYQQEDQAWRIVVWQSNKEPRRPITKPRIRVKVHNKLQSDEELLSSDEAASEEELSKFVNFDDIDNIDMTQGGANSLRSGSGNSSPESGSSTPSPIKSGQQSTTRATLTPDHSHLEEEDPISIDPVPTATDGADMEMETDMADESGHVQEPNSPETPHLDEKFPTTMTPKIRIPHSVIDLTLSADESDSEGTPSKQPMIYPRSQWFNGDPERASPAMIASWEMDALEDRADRKRVIIKILSAVTLQDRETMKTRINSIRQRYFLDEMKRGIGLIIRGRDEKLSGVTPDDSKKVLMFSRLYLCWWDCDSRWWTERVSDEPRNHQNEDQEMFYEFLKQTLLKPMKDQQSSSQLHTFAKKATEKFASQASPITISSPPSAGNSDSNEEFSEADEADEAEETEETQENSPTKKRKRPVAQSQVAMKKRESARQRRQEQTRFEEQLDSSQVGQDLPSDAIMINTSRLDEHSPVFLNKEIAAKIKKHQIEGVRFLWREIVTAAASESSGCLLAHTMGLGKTMQAISLLVTIAEAANSAEPDIRSQISKELRKPRTLILCPAALINNWVEEIDMWIPRLSKRLLGRRRSISAETPFDQRIEEIETWHEDGGILIISYPMLRIMIENKAAVKGKHPRVEEGQQEEIRKYLLDGPTIIIADEAHVMKNPNAGISQACSKFRTRNRIALTGSPLANNLMEYYSMIDWVSPGYLGDTKEFRANYHEPIQLGLWGTSSRREYRKALMQLRILKNEIEPKVNRADITVLKGSLKPKVEFVIKVPLTSLQEEAYRIYVEGILGGPNEIKDVNKAKLWSWLSVLVLVCSHPKIFFEKVLDLLKNDARSKKLPKSSVSTKPNSKKLENEDTRTSEDEFHPFDVNPSDQDSEQDLEQALEAVSLESLQVPLSMMEAQRALYKKVANLGLMEHSFKMRMVQKIIQYSKEFDDRVLIFSHSIPVLNFLEQFCKDDKTVYQRIDGSVTASSRQAAAKGFNEGRTKATVFLISTEAGGIGLNLPGANRVIILDVKYNPTWEEQAIGRAYRIGQEKPVFVYRFLSAGTFEIPLYNVSVFKTQLSYRAVDKKNVKAAADKSETYLRVPERVPQEDLRSYKGKDPHVLDRILNQEGEPWIRSISTTETLQEEIAEDFTPEEIEEIKQVEYREKLRKSDPEKWRILIREQDEAKLREQQQQAARANLVPSSSVPLPRTRNGMASGPQFRPPITPSALQSHMAANPIIRPSFPVPNGLPTYNGNRAAPPPVSGKDRQAPLTPGFTRAPCGAFTGAVAQQYVENARQDQNTNAQMGSSAPPRIELPSATAPVPGSNNSGSYPRPAQIVEELSSTEDDSMSTPGKEQTQFTQENSRSHTLTGSTLSLTHVGSKLELEDPLHQFRRAIAKKIVPVLALTNEPQKPTDAARNLDAATHLTFRHDGNASNPNFKTFPLDSPTRIVLGKTPLTLRSVYFASQHFFDSAVQHKAANGTVQTLSKAQEQDMWALLKREAKQNESSSPLQSSVAKNGTASDPTPPPAIRNGAERDQRAQSSNTIPSEGGRQATSPERLSWMERLGRMGR